MFHRKKSLESTLETKDTSNNFLQEYIKVYHSEGLKHFYKRILCVPFASKVHPRLYGDKIMNIAGGNKR